MDSGCDSQMGGMQMNSVGIDISKGRSTVAVMRPFGEVAPQPEEPAEPAPQPEEPEESEEPEAAQEPSLTEKELTAYRRAEQTERNAAVRARRIYAQLSNLCEDARTRYMDSGEEIAALAADLSTGLSRLQDAFAEVQVIFDDAQNAFDDMQLPETAAEETAE
jgi:hypothetical protein